MERITLEQKMANIGVYDTWRYLAKLYDKGLSCGEISEKLFNEYNIKITERYLSSKIKQITPLRNYSERKNNAIKRGRMVYLKKPDHERYKSKSISAKIRYEVLKRDSFACVMCGNSPKTGYSIEIHHINGSESVPDNLQTLCFQCHCGLHADKREE